MTGATVRPSMPPGFKFCGCPGHQGDRQVPLSGFNKNRSNSDGLQSRCRACQLRTVEKETTRTDEGLTPEQRQVALDARRVPRDRKPVPAEEEVEEETEEVEPNSWDRPRYWRWLVYRRYAQQGSGEWRRKTGGHDHVVDELEVARWNNETLVELAALSLSRRDRVAALAARLVGTVDGDGNRLSPAQAKRVAQRRMARADLETAMTLANEELPDWGPEDHPLGAPRPPAPKAAARPVEAPPVEEMDRPFTKHGREEESEPAPKAESGLFRRVQERFHPVAPRPIAKAKDESDPTATDGLAFEVGNVTEAEVEAFAPETHTSPEAVDFRLGRRGQPRAPKPPVSRPIPQVYCGTCKKWGLHKRLECPNRTAVERARRIHPRAAVGDTFGAYRVIALLEPDYSSNERVRVSCDNGHERDAYVFNLRRSRPRCSRCLRVRPPPIVEDATVCFYCGEEPPVALVRDRPACAVCRERVVESASHPDRERARVVALGPGGDVGLDELLVGELLRRPAAQVYDLQQTIEADGDEMRAALARLEAAGRVRRHGRGKVVLWQAVKS